jgi:L-asparaginase
MSLKINAKIVVLGTGGTIAGRRSHPDSPDIYESGRLGVADLMGQVMDGNSSVEFHDVAQIDSKNMGLPIWQSLLRAVSQAQARQDVAAVVITHGTDTLEETAYLLHAFGPWPKPVVMTCAMRPADHPMADGPDNLRDALLWAQHAQASGVCVVFNAHAHHALHVQKISTDPLTAFSSGFAPLAAEKRHGDWTWLSSPSDSITPQMPSLNGFLGATQWPRVEWLTHHAGSGSEWVEALLSAPSNRRVRGLVMAGTGAGTFKDAWEAALEKAIGLGVKVWISSRCVWGKPLPQAHQKTGELVDLPPAKACMALALALLAQDEERSAL